MNKAQTSSKGPFAGDAHFSPLSKIKYYLPKHPIGANVFSSFAMKINLQRRTETDVLKVGYVLENG